ncbi:MAG: FtsQ-type POTRA domain-containing protein, partial [Alphaproteobacteria bacterium]|nr:FtsQ-type POTRA domain-containing protein [Alphaproteobacteria bacterium]
MRALMQMLRPAGGKAGNSGTVPARRRAGRGRPLRWSPRRRLAVLLLLAVLMAGLGFATWQLQQSGIVGRTMTAAGAKLAAWGDRQIVRAGLTVQHVFVTGRGETGKPQVLRAMGVLGGQSILAFDPAEARQNLLRLGWVETARVERRLPD